MSKEKSFAIKWYIMKKNPLPWKLSKKRHKIASDCVEGKMGKQLLKPFLVGIKSYFKSRLKSSLECLPNQDFYFLKFEYYDFFGGVEEGQLFWKVKICRSK